MKEIKMPELKKFVKSGDSIEGKFSSIKKSGQFDDSFGLVLADAKGEKIKVFVNSLAKDLIEEADVKADQKIKLEYTGLKETEDKKNKYHTYKLFVE